MNEIAANTIRDWVASQIEASGFQESCRVLEDVEMIELLERRILLGGVALRVCRPCAKRIIESAIEDLERLAGEIDADAPEFDALLGLIADAQQMGMALLGLTDD